MTAVYNLCVKLINNGKTDGLQEKLDVFLACDRLTSEEYKKLISKLKNNRLCKELCTKCSYRLRFDGKSN